MVRTPTLLLLALAVVMLSPPCLAFDHTHKVWTRELKKYVDGKDVHYADWKAHPAGLKSYLGQLASVRESDYKKFSEDEKKALWINAYNAITIKLVVDHYPINGNKPYYPPRSLRQVPDVWEAFKFKVAGKDVSLDDMEHNIIRTFNDPRMHFAVVCGAKSCPQLKPEAYVATTLNADLDAAAKRYMSDPANVQYDAKKKEIRISKVFSWFGMDFFPVSGLPKGQIPPPTPDAIVAAYALSVADKAVKEGFGSSDPRISYLMFDWTLNDADAGSAAEKDKQKTSARPTGTRK